MLLTCPSTSVLVRQASLVVFWTVHCSIHIRILCGLCQFIPVDVTVVWGTLYVSNVSQGFSGASIRVPSYASVSACPFGSCPLYHVFAFSGTFVEPTTVW